MSATRCRTLQKDHGTRGFQGLMETGSGQPAVGTHGIWLDLEDEVSLNNLNLSYA